MWINNCCCPVFFQCVFIHCKEEGKGRVKEAAGSKFPVSIVIALGFLPPANNWLSNRVRVMLLSFTG